MQELESYCKQPQLPSLSLTDPSSQLPEFRTILETNPTLVDAISKSVVERLKTHQLEEASALGSYRALQNVYEQESAPGIQVRGRSNRSCTCRAYNHASILEPLSIVHFRRVFRRHHYRTCPKSKVAGESLELMMEIIPPSWLLGHTINISIAFGNWRTGRGFSFSPIVVGTRRIIDPQKSASFTAIRNCRELLLADSFANSSASIKALHNTLKNFFQDGQASPLDEDERGNTALLVSSHLSQSLKFHSKFNPGSSPLLSCTPDTCWTRL